AAKPAPKIQVRPLTELLRQEILAVTQGKLLDESDSETDKTPKKIIKPAIQLRRRTTSIAQLNYNGSREFNINASLATMDKESLKYIINNSDTIYNDHLKLRARRRLRVEIRRQLKELQSEQPKDKPATELIEDEIADAIKLPEILLQEIEKCFGIDISKEQNEACEESVKSLEEAAVHEECLETETMAGKRTNAHLNAAAAPKSPQSKCTKQKQQMKKVNTQQQLKVELDTTNAAAKSLKSAIKAELAVSDEVIVLSSSEDELEDEPQPAVCEDDVASNHSASSSNSNNSQQRRYQLKLQSDADNVVNSFETLILPHLKQSLVERYRSFHSINMQSRLHFISCVVTNSEYTTQTFSKIQVAKMQQNLKAADNRLGIEFLLREIVNVVNVQKQAAAARRKQELQQQQQQQQAANELSLKSAELASEALQRSLSDEEAAAAHVAMPTPPHSDALISLRPMQVLPLSVPYLSLDTALTPGSSYSLDSCSNAMLLGDSVSVRLMEMDRRLLDNHNRRGFLESMIMKYQKEKSDLEMQYLELQSHKFMLLNTLISRNQATTVTPPPTNTPTNSPPPPPPPAAESVSSSPKPKPRRHRRTVLVKRLKVVAKRKLPVLKVQSPSVVPAMSTEASDDANIEMPLPLPAKVQIKLETVEQTTSTKRSRWSQEDTTAAEKVAPLLPPPPPPESIANMPYELPPYIKQLQPPPPPPTPQAIDTAKYDCIATGHLRGINSPITQIRVHQLLIIAASEGGDIYMFNMLSHKLQRQITKHSDAITQMFLCESESFLYTISLDGFLKKSSLENLERVAQTVYLKEPLQSIDVAWGTAYVGSRWGNIFTYDIAANKVGSVPLIFTAQSVIALKATEDSGHRIIVLGCKGNIVTLYDASDGMMLRRLSVPEGLNIYSLQIADGYIYCGSQKNEVLKFELARSTLATTMACGNGAVAMAIYEGRYLFVGCYDSFIYVLDMHSGQQVSRINGPGRLVLALAIAGNKIIASSKDNSLAIMEIPTELLTAS
ncbi:CG14322, partial [Drosophila busckii]